MADHVQRDHLEEAGWKQPNGRRPALLHVGYNARWKQRTCRPWRERDVGGGWMIRAESKLAIPLQYITSSVKNMALGGRTWL